MILCLFIEIVSLISSGLYCLCQPRVNGTKMKTFPFFSVFLWNYSWHNLSHVWRICWNTNKSRNNTVVSTPEIADDMRWHMNIHISIIPAMNMIMSSVILCRTKISKPNIRIRAWISNYTDINSVMELLTRILTSKLFMLFSKTRPVGLLMRSIFHGKNCTSASVN